MPGSVRLLAPFWCALPLVALAAASCNSGSAALRTPSSASFDASRAWRDLESMVALGPRPSGSDAIEQNRVYIEKELRAIGLKPVRESFKEQTPAAGEIEFCNIYADLEGRSLDGKPAQMVILISHYDTKRGIPGFVGANDGASSTAVLLELARTLAKDASGDMAYRFLFVDGEEATRFEWGNDNDNTYGSRHHAAKIAADPEKKARVGCAIVIDLIGDKDLNIVWDTNSYRPLMKIFRQSALDAGLGKNFPGQAALSNAMKDDHLSFRNVGIYAADLIDFDYGPNNSYWHTAQDTIDKCSAESLDAIGRIVLGGLPAVEARFSNRPKKAADESPH